MLISNITYKFYFRKYIIFKKSVKTQTNKTQFKYTTLWDATICFGLKSWDKNDSFNNTCTFQVKVFIGNLHSYIWGHFQALNT